MQASHIGKTSTNVAKEMRGLMASRSKLTYIEAEKSSSCFIGALMNAGSCDACQRV